MSERVFPLQSFVDTVVQLLDTIQHRDTNYTREQRVKNLHYAYEKAARHFSQPHVQAGIDIKPDKLQAALQTVTRMVVYCWVNASQELMAALTIYYIYTLILDDSEDDPAPVMGSFFSDIVNGRPQQHSWWRLVNEHFPEVLKHYGPFCALNIYRSTVDFFAGCWIEQYNFHGYRGAEDYPDFLRRLNGLGHAVGASIWPLEMFDEKVHFKEITTATCMMENWMVWVNDLISFYKEFDDPRDQTSLINNYAHVEGLTTIEALEKLTRNTIRVSEQIMAVFADKDPRVVNTLTRFMHGWVTWHLCDKRYRIDEVNVQVDGNNETNHKFHHCLEEANKVGRVDASEWAVPTATTLIETEKINASYVGWILSQFRQILGGFGESREAAAINSRRRPTQQSSMLATMKAGNLSLG